MDVSSPASVAPPSFAQSFNRWQRWLICALLVILTFALYRTTLGFAFVWDDFFYINRDFRIHSLTWRYFSSVWSSTYLGHYAPVHNTLLAVLYHFYGQQPFGYHLAQLLLHAACVCALYLVLSKLEVPRVALLASLLFAVHPTNVETVAWISETKSTLAFLFFLISFWFYIRLRERERWTDAVWVGLFLVLSVLSKINTVVAPAIFFLYDYREGFPPKKSRPETLGAFFVISAAMTAIHVGAFHHSTQELASSYQGGLSVHLQNLPFILWFYIRMALFPWSLSAVELFHVYEHWDRTVAGAWVALLLTVWLLYRGSRRVQFWALWFFICLAPVLQVVPNTIWIADRYLYVPLAGAAVLCSLLFFRITDAMPARHWKIAADSGMALVLALMIWKTHNQVPIWRNDLTLWEATLPTCETAAYCHAALGQALLIRGQTQRGGDEVFKAASMEPTPLNLMYLADALTVSAHNYPEAIRIYQMALRASEDPRERTGPSLVAVLYGKLARAFIHQGQLSEATVAIQAGVNVNGTEPTLAVVNGFLQWKKGNSEAARSSLRAVLLESDLTSQPERFIDFYWGDETETNQMLAELRSSPSNSPQTHSKPSSQSGGSPRE